MEGSSSEIKNNNSPILPDSFLSALLRKLSDAIRIEQVTGLSTAGAQEEVWRQIRQLKNPITGEGVTKSGSED